ncbi:MAG: tagK [Massilibacillus sp.]|nr:tagK [Massilibacillus sp.]
MIYTLTTNPAIDMNVTTNGIKPRLVNRTSNTIYSPNGKGINVTLVLKHFQVNSHVLGFFGGFTGKYILDQLTERNVVSSPIWVEDTTRINIFVNDGEDEYKFVNAGSVVPKEKQIEFLKKLRSLDDCEYLVISGSLPQGIPLDYYDEIFSICDQKGIKVILDISSRKLKELLKYKPLLIKPNDEEIKDIFGAEIKDETDVVKVLKFLGAEGAQNVLLTLGEKGAYFSDGKSVYFCTAKPIQLVSSACAGDAALGAFLSEWLLNDNVEAALKKSAATGANVAESNALGNLKNVNAYMEHIIVRKVGN